MPLSNAFNTVGLWVIVTWVLMAVVNISFALGVMTDAEQQQGKTVFVGGPMWALATLMGGVFVAATYWLIHHSSLRVHRVPPTADPAQRGPG